MDASREGAMGVAKAVNRPDSPPTAYGDDFYTWTQEQGARLRAGNLDGLDLENLAEEIESLGKSQFASLVSALRIVLLHMLKFDHQPERRSRSWIVSIATHRDHAAEELEESPGLKNRLNEAIGKAYRRARLEAYGETGLPLDAFPEVCPYSLHEIMNRPFATDPDV
ncbi:DUF29 domain-containing protein [Methylobacterium aerolatum]|uniref:DUF29 domain-containing protein n=1 Tax=Methylobacterium aerolatum TaxID=418708 RepID=A0ABU0HUF7_9HYPH|nr:DUF29 family protein [Methylobacterium aerolatum]MDQ0445921.1 hypothetical protein [Methylobacterium aerolatum]GJD35819.1 hypothetical protein FMGBMHLM_2731 [Methylobacterium aerolatum]